MKRIVVGLVFFWVGLWAMYADAGTISRPTKSFGGTSFVNGVVPQASDFNGDIDTIYSEFNGEIDNANVASDADIAGTKISPSFDDDVVLTRALPCVQLIENDQAADQKRWDLCVSGGVLQILTKTDAGATTITPLQIARATGDFTLVGDITAVNVSGTGNLDIDGTGDIAGALTLGNTGGSNHVLKQSSAGGVVSSGTVTDAEVDDNITAGQLAANGSNCSAGDAAGGVDASGAAEDCTTYVQESGDTMTGELTLSGEPTSGLNAIPLRMLQGYLAGLGMSNGTDADHDIDIADGVAVSDDADTAMRLGSTLTKQIDAVWSSGSAAGGRASGVSLSTDTWYHVFVVDDSGGSIDAGFDTSLTASNLLSDTGGSNFRRIGSVLTDSSSNILGFFQQGDRFLWSDPPLDVDASADRSSAVLYTLSVPTGLQVLALITVGTDASSNDDNLYISSPSVNDEAPTSPATTSPLPTLGEFLAVVNGGGIGAYLEIVTNTSGQVRTRANDATSNLLRVTTHGWIDQRGKD